MLSKNMRNWANRKSKFQQYPAPAMIEKIEAWASRVAKLEQVAEAARELHKEWWCEELSEDFMPEELVKLDEALKELGGFND